MAGVGGFEPPHGGIKIRCLTAWLHPNIGYEASFRQLLWFRKEEKYIFFNFF